MKYSWQIFNNWDYSVQEKISKMEWNLFRSLSSSFASAYYKKTEYLNSLISKWDNILNEYGGEPLSYNWDAFRPLRLTREEDWSDWLIFLISESRTGYFSSKLFKITDFTIDDYSLPPMAGREVEASACRADVIIKWKNDHYSHIEVKIGDEHLDKTYETSEKMKSHFSIHRDKWHDHILLMEDQVPAWEGVSQKYGCEIQPVTWYDVALSLRKSLIYSEEKITWKVWAYSFLGAIEQKLLRLKKESHLCDFDWIDKSIRLYEAGLENG